MITSMTGYGDAQGALDGIELTVEIRCLNSRYYKPSIRLPDELAELEVLIDPLLRKAVSRGTLLYTLRIKVGENTAGLQINYPAVRSLLHELHELQRDLGFEGINIDLTGLLQLPSLTRPAEYSQDQKEQLKQLVLQLSNKALDALAQMRQREGEVLYQDFCCQCQTIRSHLDKIAQAAPQVIRSYHAKLLQRANELLNGSKVTLGKEDLAREIAIFSERCDISEEIVRLQSHLDHFDQVCRQKSQTGRRLDFIAQEMLREANTIGAKASDVDIAASVVEIKTAVDRIKEQVQNVE